MRYRLFFVDPRALPGEGVDLSKLMSVAFDSKDAAFERAREYIKRGSTIVRITGPEGFLMTDADLVVALGA
jgi:hypothetical protein